MKPSSIFYYGCGHTIGNKHERGSHIFSTGKCLECAPRADEAPAVHTFYESTYPQLMGSDSKRVITSKRELKQLAHEKGFYSEYAEG